MGRLVGHGAGLGLRARILSLAAVPILGLLFVLAVEHFAARRTAAAEDVYDSQRDLVSHAIKLRSEVSAMRIAADGFRLSKDRKSEIAFREARDVAALTLGQLEGWSSTRLFRRRSPISRRVSRPTSTRSTALAAPTGKG
jgi:hypothetical protein